jgi:hypothetical protein
MNPKSVLTKAFIILALFICAGTLHAQKYTISGYVRDKSSAESLIGANVFEKRLLSGTTTNTYGFYSLTLSSDSVSIIFSYVGYTPIEVKFFLGRDTTINAELGGTSFLNEIVVTAEASDPIQERTQMSTISVPIAQIKSMPALLGEVDVLKVLQLLPGVQSGTEGASGLYVRGGGPDQNLILLDGVPVYNASHLFGFFSVFNADAINNVELIKGGFPARYGGRLSSVIDISLKEGNMKKFQGEGSIGLISSKLTLEGPIIKDKTSFIVSGRRTYIDILTRPLIKAAGDGEVVGYYFYDLNTKLNHKFSDKDRLYLSVYLGDDKFYAKYKYDETYNDQTYKSDENAGIAWGNITTALRWNHMINQKLFSNTTLTYSRYRFNTFMEEKSERTFNGNTEKEFYSLKYISGIQDYAAKIDFDYLPNPNHYIRFGSSAIRHSFNPGAFGYKETQQTDTTFGAQKMYAMEFAVYAEDDIKINDRLKLNAGVHFSGFGVENRFYNSLQPRVAARYLITPTLSYKISYNRMNQFIHLLTNSGIGLPTDLWVPSTGLIRPQRAEQVAIGLAKNLKSTYEISLEGYFKKMNNLIEYKEGASFFNIDKDWQGKIESGEGRSYGAELFLQKKYGSVTGWLGYTLSWSDRTFQNLNFGQTFPYKYDRRHDVSMTMMKKLGKKIEFSTAWVYGTGSAVTLPVASYYEGHGMVNDGILDYGYRNAFRMRSYHRLDVSFSFVKTTRWGERRWTLGAYNVYNRKNPFYIDVKRKYNSDYTSSFNQFVQYSLFPIIPSVSYSFKF